MQLLVKVNARATVTWYAIYTAGVIGLSDSHTE